MNYKKERSILKKIGIITMTGGENYGNKLQNYAVQEVIKKLGYSPETIINTTTIGFNKQKLELSYIQKLNPLYVVKVIKFRINKLLFIKNEEDRYFKSIFWTLKHKRKINKILEERKNVFLNFFNTKIISSDFSISVDNYTNENLSNYEFFFAGSDQIWNPYYQQNSIIDFLGFAPESKRISFAPSFGVNTIPNYRKGLYKEWLNSIPYLSVREEQGAAIIKRLTGREAIVLVDPTMMLSKNEWAIVSKIPKMETNTKYILTYFLGNQTDSYRKYIEKIANIHSCKIVNLSEIREFKSYIFSPEEFIYLINNAALVCTDSFHGTIFSIIMQTNFIVFERKEGNRSMNSRLETLLNKFDMTNRSFKNMVSNKNPFSTNFNNAKKIIQLEQDKTWEFLKKATNI